MSEAGNVDALVHQVQVQHKELHRMLQEIRSQSDRLAAAQEATDAVARLKDTVHRLRTFLQRHFQQEEEGGWLEEAAARMPRLSHSLTELENQHRELLEQTDRVFARLEATSRDPHGAAPELIALAEAISAHEAQEEEVLSQGFNQDIDVAD